MMQMPETPNLFNAMNRFLGAVNNMDQTIMVPSLLRDVPLDEDRELGSLKSETEDGDMYSYYQLLKSIRRDMEWGVRCADDEKRKEDMKLTRSSSSASTGSCGSSVASFSSEEDEEEQQEEEDLHEQFQYHLTGLQGVLSKLTQSAISLTKRYKKEVGIGGWGQ